MPRRLATQVPQTISRLLQGQYIKAVPSSYSALVAHPPVPIPPRAPFPRTLDDLPEGYQRKAGLAADGSSEQNVARRRDANNSKKKMRTRTPSLKPKPIVYLEDRVRRQFFLDHPWEGLRPRTLVEQETVAQEASAPAEVTELTWWSTNPQPEDAIAFSVHLHRHHNLSLAQAYHQALAQYHALRAEHETASRYALLEAQAYGATFAHPKSKEMFQERVKGPMPFDAAPETYRTFLKETEELARTAAEADRTEMLAAAAASGSSAASFSGDTGKLTIRVRSAARPGSWSGGADYLKRAQTIPRGNVDAFANARASREASSPTSSRPTNIPAALAAPGSKANAVLTDGQRADQKREMNDPSQLIAGLEERAIAAGQNR